MAIPPRCPHPHLALFNFPTDPLRLPRPHSWLYLISCLPEKEMWTGVKRPFYEGWECGPPSIFTNQQTRLCSMDRLCPAILKSKNLPLFFFTVLAKKEGNMAESNYPLPWSHEPDVQLGYWKPHQIAINWPTWKENEQTWLFVLQRKQHF